MKANEEPLLDRPRAASLMEALPRRHSTGDAVLGFSTPRIGRSASFDALARFAYHVEDVLLHNEEGAPRTIGRTLPEHLTRGASLRTTVFNLVSTMLGSGMLSLPWVFACLGMRGGLVLMLLTPLVGERTIWFVTAACSTSSHEEPERTLPPLVERMLGKRAALLCAFTLISLNYGVLVSYCIVIKGLLPGLAADVLQLAVPPSTSLCLSVVAATCLVPLSSMESMDQLRYASIASVVLVYVFVGCICVAGVATLMEDGKAKQFLHPDEWSRGDLLDWLRCIPVVGFSYLCHMNVPSFFVELRRQSPNAASAVPRRFHFGAPASAPADASLCDDGGSLGSRWRTKRDKFQAATRAAMVVAVILYAATALGGYAAFGIHSKPNVLQNLQPGPDMPLPDSMVVFLHAAFVGTMITTFPTISHGLRQSLHALLYPGNKPETQADRWLEAAGLIGAVVAVACAVDSLGLVFQFVGSTCGSLLTFIFPACFRLFGRLDAHVDSQASHEEDGGGGKGPGRATSAVSATLRALEWAVELGVAWGALLLGLTLAIGGSALALGWIG